MTRMPLVLAMATVVMACAPKAPPSWERGNCLASTPAATQLALLRAHADSSPLFLRGATDVPALQDEATTKAPLLAQDTIEVRHGDAPPAAAQLSDAWWRAVRSVHPMLEYVESSNTQVIAIGRLALDSTHTAYLLRVPGVEVNHGDELWIADNARQCFLLPQLVAFGWGDAGETSALASWLLDIDGDGVRELVQHSVSSVTTESPTDTIETTEVTDSVVVLRWVPPRFSPDSSFDLSRIPWARPRTPP